MTLGPRFEQALAYATQIHTLQKRKGTPVPYVSHLLSVCALVLEDGDEDEAIAALLHDAVEDQGGAPRLDDITARFGARVASIVRGCTDTDLSPKPPWLERKQAYIAELEGAPPEVVRVALADKLYNARTILRDYRQLGEALWERFDPHSDQLWYYGTLFEVFQRVSESQMVRELSDVMHKLEGETFIGSLGALMHAGSGYVTVSGGASHNGEVTITLEDDGLFLHAGDDVEELTPSGPWDLPEIASRARACLSESFGVAYGCAVSIDTSWRAERRGQAAAEAELRTRERS